MGSEHFDQSREECSRRRSNLSLAWSNLVCLISNQSFPASSWCNSPVVPAGSGQNIVSFSSVVYESKDPYVIHNVDKYWSVFNFGFESSCHWDPFRSHINFIRVTFPVPQIPPLKAASTVRSREGFTFDRSPKSSKSDGERHVRGGILWKAFNVNHNVTKELRVKGKEERTWYRDEVGNMRYSSLPSRTKLSWISRKGELYFLDFRGRSKRTYHRTHEHPKKPIISCKNLAHHSKVKHWPQSWVNGATTLLGSKPGIWSRL